MERFFQARDALAPDGLGAQAEAVLNGFSPTYVRAVLTRLSNDDRSIPPPLDPMLPALAETVLSWSGGQRQVLVIHDEQSAFTADRLTRLQRALANDGAPSPAGADEAGALAAGVSPLAGLVMVDSRDDPRVQVADLLAGVARRLPGVINDVLLQTLLSPTPLRDPESDLGSLSESADDEAFAAEVGDDLYPTAEGLRSRRSVGGSRRTPAARSAARLTYAYAGGGMRERSRWLTPTMSVSWHWPCLT